MLLGRSLLVARCFLQPQPLLVRLVLLGPIRIGIAVGSVGSSTQVGNHRNCVRDQ